MVTGVCSGKNAEMVRSIGADHVIDYTQEDFTQGDARYDFILDNVGNATELGERVGQLLAPFLSTNKAEDLVVLKEMAKDGKITPVIDSTYPLAETARAMSHVGEGHASGTVVITV